LSKFDIEAALLFDSPAASSRCDSACPVGYAKSHCQLEQGADMMQITDMPTGMMLGMGLVWILIILFLILGIAACIKYLRS